MTTWYKPRCEEKIVACIGDDVTASNCEVGPHPTELWFAMSYLIHNTSELQARHWLDGMAEAAERTGPRAVAAYKAVLARHRHVSVLVAEINAETLRVYREAFFSMGVCFTGFPRPRPSVSWGGSKLKESDAGPTYCLPLRRTPLSRPKLRTPRLVRSVVKPWTVKQESQS